MGLFSSKKEGGFMDVIRCDEDDYLVWKWRPNGQDLNSTKKENSIRYGSRLHVKDGELAVFVYKQDNGTQQDFIEGPYDGKIETANFPILTSIVGLAFGGDSPFQAEVYFINLQGNNQVRFGVPFFDVFDPRFLDFAVPMAARGTLTFNITDYRGFIKQNRLVNFDKDDFSLQIQDAVRRYVKGFISNAPSDYGIPVLQIERRILDINTMIHQNLAPIFANDFGVNLKRLDLSAIEVDKESDGYIELRSVTADIQAATTTAQAEINIKNMADMQQINADNMAESLRVQREEMQRAQRLQTETNFIGAHALDQQADVLKTAAGNLGSMSSMGGGGGMLCVPALMWIAGLNEQNSHATAMLVILPLSVVSAIIYFLNNNIQLFDVLSVAGGVLIGGILGAILLKKLPAKVTAICFIIIMLLAGIKMVV